MKKFKQKKVLVKRIRLDYNNYDFELKNSETEANSFIKNTKDLTEGIKYVRANLYERFTYSLEQFFKEKTKEIFFSIILIALTLLAQYVYDKWIKP